MASLGQSIILIFSPRPLGERRRERILVGGVQQHETRQQTRRDKRVRSALLHALYSQFVYETFLATTGGSSFFSDSTDSRVSWSIISFNSG